MGTTGLAVIARVRHDIELANACEAEEKRRHTVAEPPASAPLCLNMPLNEEEMEENIDFCCCCVAAAPLPAPAPTCPAEEELSTGRSAPDDALERDMPADGVRAWNGCRVCACFLGASRLPPRGRESRNGRTSNLPVGSPNKASHSLWLIILHHGAD